jgi:hypothetical protein
MATKAKSGLTRKTFMSRAKFKHTRQGNGLRSLAKPGKKLRRGQGK